MSTPRFEMLSLLYHYEVKKTNREKYPFEIIAEQTHPG